MKELTDKLEKWGADPVEALHRMLDDEPFYKNLLEKFIKKKEWELFRNAVEEENYQKAFRLAHDIKGTTAVLSLTPIYSAVSVLVEELREGEPGEGFRDELKIFFREIKMLQEIVSGEER